MNEVAIPGYETIKLYSDAPDQEYLDRCAYFISFTMNKMDKYFNETCDPHLEIINSQTLDGPKNLYDSPTIRLKVKNNFWINQMIYQFAHEYCHRLIASPNPSLNTIWFEEIICECSSRFFLNKILKEKHPNYNDYMNDFKFYYDRLFTEENIPWNLQDSLPLSSFDNSELSFLINESTGHDARPHLQYAANKLYPVFDEYQGIWKVIPYLKNFNNKLSFEDNLKMWRKNTGNFQIYKILDIFKSP